MFAGKTEDKIKFLETDYDVQLIRQAGKKAQDHIPFMGRMVVNYPA